MKVSRSSSFLAGFYLAIVVWWLVITRIGQTDSDFNFGFALAYGLIPVMGGILGMRLSKKWGLFKSVMGKSIFFLSMGLLTWGLGEIIWSYYVLFLHVEVPYPSWADASFILSWPLWTIGVIYLALATGAKYALKNVGGLIQVIILPVIALIVSYYLLIVVARQGILVTEGNFSKTFFDLAYPILDVLILSIALLAYGLTFKLLGGRYKWPVLIVILGYAVNYFADFGFSYTTTVGTFYNGNWVDLLFATAMFVSSYGVNSLSPEVDT